MSLRKFIKPIALNTRYYHPSNCGRALMGSPEVQPPPKNYYLYHY